MNAERIANRRAVIIYIIVMSCFGTLGVFVKKIQLPSVEMAMWRGVIAAGVLSAVLFVQRKKRLGTVPKSAYIRLVISGVVMGLDWIVYAEALKYTSIALTTLSYYFAPTLVIIMGALIFRERLTKKQIVCFVLSTLGLVLMIGVSRESARDFIGIAFGLSGALFYAVMVLINKSIRDIDFIQKTQIQMVSAAVVLVIYTLATSNLQIASADATTWINLAIVGVFHTGILYSIYFSTLAYLKGQQAAILSYLDPLAALMISVLLLGEPLGIYQWIGGGIILGATFANEFKGKKAKETQ